MDFPDSAIRPAQRIRATRMKTNSIDWKLPAIIGILVTVALLINVFFFKRAAAQREAKAQEQRQAVTVAEAKLAAEKSAQEKKDAEEAQRQAANAQEAKRVRDEADAKAKLEDEHKKVIEATAAEHSRFLARYLNSGFTRPPGIATIAVAIESERGTMNPAVANALTRQLTNGGLHLLNSYFKPEFVADKFVDSILSGDTGIFARLELTNSLNGVLVGRQTVTYSTNATFDNTVTANLELEVRFVPVVATQENQSWDFSANGIGMRPYEARQLAEQRIIEQIATSTNMVLPKQF